VASIVAEETSNLETTPVEEADQGRLRRRRQNKAKKQKGKLPDKEKVTAAVTKGRGSSSSDESNTGYSHPPIQRSEFQFVLVGNTANIDQGKL
jgi:hypothetical protein